MRLFIALSPPPAFRDALGALQESLRAAGVTGRWLDPANLHLTLAFIGHQPEPDAAAACLPRVDAPFPVGLSHPGVFPEAGVLWAGTEASDPLDRLAARGRESLSAAGLPFDPKPFRPHITLARKPRLPEGLSLADFPVPPAEMTVREVCLYHSHRGEEGMLYTVIARSPAD